MTGALSFRFIRLAAVVLIMFAATSAVADLGAPTVNLTGAELRLVAENPALLRLGEQDPAFLRAVLDRLEAMPLPASKGIDDALKGDGPATSALSPEDQTLLDQNPALGKAMRDSPEAALDLIRLIKQAAQAK